MSIFKTHKSWGGTSRRRERSYRARKGRESSTGHHGGYATEWSSKEWKSGDFGDRLHAICGKNLGDAEDDPSYDN